MTSEPIRIDSADIAENVDEANLGLLRAIERYVPSDADQILSEVSDES